MARRLPKDADGDALRGLIAAGSDLSRPMSINFQVAVPDEASARQLAALARKLGYQARASASPDCALPWTCE